MRTTELMTWAEWRIYVVLIFSLETCYWQQETSEWAVVHSSTYSSRGTTAHQYITRIHNNRQVYILQDFNYTSVKPRCVYGFINGTCVHWTSWPQYFYENWLKCSSMCFITYGDIYNRRKSKLNAAWLQQICNLCNFDSGENYSLALYTTRPLPLSHTIGWTNPCCSGSRDTKPYA